MTKKMLASALLMCNTFLGAERLHAIDKTNQLHELYNQRNLTGTMSRHKAKMKCKKYCLPKKRK